MNDPNQIFKIDDIKDNDPLKDKKVNAINEVKNWFSANLNNARADDDYWVQRGYYVEPWNLEPADLVFALEEKKAFISWFMKSFPQFNVPYDPAKRKGGMKNLRFKNKEAKKGKYAPKHDREWGFEVKPNLLARERDFLFGTNNTAIITVENWRERIRDATTQEEIEDIKSLMKSRWKIDDFVHNCRGLIDIACQNMQDLKVNVGMYPNHYESAKTFLEWLFKSSLKRLEGKILNEKDSWGSWEAKTAIFREAGMKWSHYITYKALKDELEKTYYLVKEKAEEKRVEWDWKSYSLFSPKKAPTPNSKAPPTPSSNSVPSPNPNVPSDDDKKKNPPLSENEINQKLEKAKTEITKLAKPKNPDQPGQKALSKEKKEQKIAEIEELINELEEKDESGSSNKILAELKEQVQELQRQLAEIKKSLKEILENAKDYTRKLLNWFKNKGVKKITLQDKGNILIEYNAGETKTLSQKEVEENETLVQFKEYCQQSQEKFLTFSELSQISNVSSPTTNQKHWDKYRKCYIGGIIITALASVGIVVYFWTKKRKNKK
ncbi:MAG: hypothetical protein I3273_00345 [Candidatus Moeniiplasma glomeromycotorum]|nr:hypothetical protein [Candidatus Moeniiplasma glomeromycotorum]MCE8167421.1 hypothetical protein [Candidatus Moeniiplasma glomeromycotorum]MCE8168565.1 hypothetical protein [Candidatus Moeniiplasma glomeromycotorum]